VSLDKSDVADVASSVGLIKNLESARSLGILSKSLNSDQEENEST
jgi:hypothetical protein